MIKRLDTSEPKGHLRVIISKWCGPVCAKYAASDAKSKGIIKVVARAGSIVLLGSFKALLNMSWKREYWFVWYKLKLSFIHKPAPPFMVKSVFSCGDLAVIGAFRIGSHSAVSYI